MTEEATLILDIAEEKMNKALEHLVEALLGIRAGKASIERNHGGLLRFADARFAGGECYRA